MHGDVAYCRKHGHDWHVIDRGHLEESDDILYTHVECKRCGINHILYSFFAEDDE